MTAGDYWGLTGLAVLAVMGLLAAVIWVDGWLERQADRRQDRREGWTEPPSRLDRLDHPDGWLP